MSADVHPVVGLRVEPHDGETLADLIVRAGQAKALSAFAADLERQAKTDLREAAEADVARAGGGGFSRTVDGVRATLTDPQPRPQVSDREAFAAWWVEQGRPHDVRKYVEVLDQDRAVTSLLECLRDGAHADHAILDLFGALAVRTEILLPEGALDQLTTSGAYKPTDGGLVEVSTGEVVPGVDCYRASPVLQLVPSKEAKARDAAIVRSFFGLPVELPGGGR